MDYRKPEAQTFVVVYYYWNFYYPETKS